MRQWMIGIGGLFLANAAWMLIQRVSARGTAVGKVVDHHAETGTSTEPGSVPTTLYHPIIEFADTSGKRHRFTAVGGDPQRRPSRASRMRIRYRAGDPETAYVATFAQMWVMPIAWAAIGGGMLYFSWWG